MKKSLLVLLLISFAIFGYSQNGCFPDPIFTTAGVYPDSATGLLPAYVGQIYSQNITLITPVDTSVASLGGITVDVDSINLTSVSGLPYGFSYNCDPPNCSFAGGTSRCAELFSTVVPDDSLIGIHQIVFSTKSFVTAPWPVGQIEQVDVIDYYSIDISATTSVINKIEKNTFELKGAYPNPVTDEARIQFISGDAGDVIFMTYNLLGKEIDSQKISCVLGVNTINLNTSLYNDGIYLYSINNGSQLLTKRMIVKN